ncbi:hypothetical protein [Nocardioides sp.]|uniref:hypothetical protein n=1 Tax=Nocardioides sp. TaxID=35761 RepID=UPI00262F6171|nr:hypothetical protein [Nocardioides sp.]
MAERDMRAPQVHEPAEVVLDLDRLVDPVRPSGAEASDFTLVTHDNSQVDNTEDACRVAALVGPAFRAHVAEGAAMREPGLPLYEGWPLDAGQQSPILNGWRAAPHAITVGLLDPDSSEAAALYFLTFLPGLEQPVSDFAWTRPEYRRRGLYRRLRLHVDFVYDPLRGGAWAPGVTEALERAGLTAEQVHARRMGPDGTDDPAAIASIAATLFRNSKAYQAERFLGSDVIDDRRERLHARMNEDRRHLADAEFELRRAVAWARLAGDSD